MPDIILNPRPVGTIFSATKSADPTTSLTAVGAKVLSFDGMLPANTAIKIQVRLSDDGAWVSYQDVSPAAPNLVVAFPTIFNRVRVVGLVAGITVVAQG
jgi:hypothetical protein